MVSRLEWFLYMVSRMLSSDPCWWEKKGHADVWGLATVAEKRLTAADLWSGLADGELPHPLLVVHHALLGVAHQLGAQHPPGQPQVQCSLGGTGPVLQRDHTCGVGISQVSTLSHSEI